MDKSILLFVLFLIYLYFELKNFTHIREGTENLKTAIDLKNQAQSILKKYDNLNIKSNQESQKPKIDFSEKNIKLKESLPCTSKSLYFNEEKKSLDSHQSEKLEMLKVISNST